MGAERRRHPRVALDVEADCVGAMIAHAKDVSESGICLIGKEALPEGKMLDLRFSLPGSAEPIHAFGKVIWSKKGRCLSLRSRDYILAD